MSFMPKEKSKPQQAMDKAQERLRPLLRELGFRARARAFNRFSSGGLTQVIDIQMGRFDPPGTYEIGIRKNMYGKFTVNVGIYVPEVFECLQGCGGKPSFIREYDCCIGGRLGNLGPEHEDKWWDLLNPIEAASDVFSRLRRDALPFFSEFETREALLEHVMKARLPHNWRGICAVILARQGRKSEAKVLLDEYAEERKDHPSLRSILALASTLGLGSANN